MARETRISLRVGQALPERVSMLPCAMQAATYRKSRRRQRILV
jgi:hypothetical protein